MKVVLIMGTMPQVIKSEPVIRTFKGLRERASCMTSIGVLGDEIFVELN